VRPNPATTCGPKEIYVGFTKECDTALVGLSGKYPSYCRTSLGPLEKKVWHPT